MDLADEAAASVDIKVVVEEVSFQIDGNLVAFDVYALAEERQFTLQRELSSIGESHKKLGQEGNYLPVDGKTERSVGVVDINMKAKHLELLLNR